MDSETPNDQSSYQVPDQNSSVQSKSQQPAHGRGAGSNAQAGQMQDATNPMPQSAHSITDSQSVIGRLPQIADDTDLIEKEWVDKAKEVIARTAHDPYLQNQELNRVKVEYLKKRYNKDVKQSD